MKTFKSNYFSNCKSYIKLLSILIFCFLPACDGQNETKQSFSPENRIQAAETAVNINTASVAELEKLPHIGAKTAGEIIKHREQFGKFRKPEHLLLVRGISDRRFREMKNLIKVE
jgi:competence protein ComEA